METLKGVGHSSFSPEKGIGSILGVGGSNTI